MGWFWDSKTNQDSDSTASDPYSKLDPALRDFLDKESPLKYEETLPKPRALKPPPSRSSRDGASTTFRSQLGLDTPGVDQENQDAIPKGDRPAVPPESLFPDGRYAHLWKTYRPQTEVEAASRSDQDRLAAVMEAYHDRKAAIGRAAVENCVIEQMAEQECYKSGPWKSRMTMCRTENRAFNRCYEMQARFLKALGYLSNQHRSADEEERIQMHADKLYHEMLAREEAAEEAKQADQPAPTFQPLIEPETTTAALGSDSAWARARQRAQEVGLSTNMSAYGPEKQKQIQERIKGLSDQKRELELHLIAAESRAQLEYAEQIKEEMDEERRLRADRRERGKETIGDSIKRLAGWK